METERIKNIIIYGSVSLFILIFFSTLFSSYPKITGNAFFLRFSHSKPNLIHSSTPQKHTFFLNFFRRTKKLIDFKHNRNFPITKPISFVPKVANSSVNISIGDSDGGVLSYKYGICKDEERILKDHCDLKNPKILLESKEIKQGNAIICTFTSIFCKFGCKNGICLNNLTQPNIIKIKINDKAKEIVQNQ